MRRNARLAAFLFGILLILLGLVITLQDLHSRRVQHGIAVGETIDLLFPSNSPPGVAAMTALVYVTAPRKIRVGQSAPVSINVSTPQSRRPSFRLSAAGLDVEPNDWVPLHAVSEY